MSNNKETEYHLPDPLPDRFVLVNARLVLPDRVTEAKGLLVEDGIIVEIDDDVHFQTGKYGDVLQIDVGRQLVTPGLIDIHIHGALGHTFNDATSEAFGTIACENAKRGVTALLATTATDSIENLTSALALTQEWMREARPGAQIVGAHVEGPYFAMSQRGAQDPAHIRNPDDGSVERLLEFSELIRIFTFAPELPGARSLTERLADLAIVAAAGHSEAREEDVAGAIDSGLSHMIHMWSAQSTTIREGPWRKPGLLEVSLTDERVTGEIIADGKHLPPTLMKLAYKCLGADRLCAVSDATSGAGLAQGSHFRMGGMEYEVHDGVGMLFDRTAFAGSTTLLNQMLPILIDQVGIPLVEAVRMATLTPASVIGIDRCKGSLEVGKDADIVIFDTNFEARGVIIGGQWASG